MNAEIIAVGTELLLGQTINTDAAIVARTLSELGINLLYSSVVGDNAGRLSEALSVAQSRSDLVILTGGLGPTQDDITVETAAACAGVRLVHHAETEQRLMTFFQGQPLSGNQLKQAMLPEGCTVFQNDNGTAPGCALKTKMGCTFILLPGPPSELEPMLKNSVAPYLANGETGCILSHHVHVFGLGEAAVAQMMSDLIEGSNPTVAPYAKEGEMFLRVTAKAETEQQAEALCAPVLQEIQARLGDKIYAIDCDTLEETVVALLTEKGKTIATAESCTGGLLAKRLTDVSGSSNVFEMGCVTYANWVKENLIDVPKDLLERYGAVSLQVASAMAEGVQRLSGADLGIGITGIAGPEGGSAEKPVGLVYIALSDGESTFVASRNPIGRAKSRKWHRHCAASHALDMIRRYLNGIKVC